MGLSCVFGASPHFLLSLSLSLGPLFLQSMDSRRVVDLCVAGSEEQAQAELWGDVRTVLCREIDLMWCSGTIFTVCQWDEEGSEATELPPACGT